MLKIKDLNVSYEKSKKNAVSNINFEIKTGEIICIVGESGSGKTTIIKTIMELLPKDALTSGTIFYKNQELKRVCPKEISMVFQDTRSALNPVRKIGVQFTEYIRKHMTLTKKDALELAINTLTKMNLNQNVLNSYPCELSGGMMQRVGLAFSLSLAPNLLLLDEPTSALDVTTQAQVIDEIIKLKHEFDISILMITHNIPLAIYMADTILVMKNGNIIENNSSKNILENPQDIYTKTLIKNIPKLDLHYMEKTPLL